MILVALLAAAVGTAAPAAVPGVYFEQTTSLRQPDGIQVPGVRSRVWCAGSRLRLEAADAPGPALLLRLDEGRAFRLDPETRVAAQLDVARLRARAQADAAVAAGLMGRPGGRLRSTPLEARRMIAGHRCRAFRISGSDVLIEAWVAEDLALRADVFADFVAWSGAAQALPELVETIRALPGFPLETRMRVNVLDTPQETVSTITLIRVRPVAEERFEIPPGWRVVEEPPEDAEPPGEAPR